MAQNLVIDAVFRAVDRITAPVRRIIRAVRRASRIITRALRPVGRAFVAMGRFAARSATRITLWGTATAAAVGVAIVALNRATTESLALSDAVGMNIDSMEGLAAAIKPAGFEMDNVVDLVEELNNKLGESAGLAQTTPVQESLKILGLEFRKLKALKPAEQFEKVMDAAIGMADAQKAAAAADILLGGEANKVLGVLRRQGKTIAEITAAYREMNFQTEGSRASAERFTGAFNRMSAVIVSVAKFAAGLAGEALTPLIDRLTDWAIANKTLIQSKIRDFISDTARLITRLSGALAKMVEGDKGKALFAGITDGATTAAKAVLALANGILTVAKVVDTGADIAAAVISEPIIQANRAASFLRGGGGGNFIPAPVNSPVERSAEAIREVKETNTTEVTIRDETGRADITRGGKAPGFNMLQTGAL